MNQLSEYDLYGTRLLIFMEEKSYTNKYRQVLLTRQQFKVASLALGKVIARSGDNEEVELRLSNDIYPLPDLKQHSNA